MVGPKHGRLLAHVRSGMPDLFPTSGTSVDIEDGDDELYQTLRESGMPVGEALEAAGALAAG
jgi:hypothetical protein